MILQYQVSVLAIHMYPFWCSSVRLVRVLDLTFFIKLMRCSVHIYGFLVTTAWRVFRLQMEQKASRYREKLRIY
jgi:hypothetical protein